MSDLAKPEAEAMDKCYHLERENEALRQQVRRLEQLVSLILFFWAPEARSAAKKTRKAGKRRIASAG